MTLKTVVKKGQSVLSLLSEEEKKKYIYCRIDQVIHELTYEFPEDGEKEIHFFDLTDTLAMKIYASSMCYLTAFAVRELNPRIEHLPFSLCESGQSEELQDVEQICPQNRRENERARRKGHSFHQDESQQKRSSTAL